MAVFGRLDQGPRSEWFGAGVLRRRHHRAPGAPGAAGMLASVEVSFADAVRALAMETASEWRAHLLFEATPDCAVSDPQVRSAVLDIVGEAMQNAYRHGGRHTTARIQIGKRSVTVTDDGPGFNLMAHRPGSGLIAMRRTARAAGVRLRIASSLGQGTTVEVALPG